MRRRYVSDAFYPRTAINSGAEYYTYNNNYSVLDPNVRPVLVLIVPVDNTVGVGFAVDIFPPDCFFLTERNILLRVPGGVVRRRRRWLYQSDVRSKRLSAVEVSISLYTDMTYSPERIWGREPKIIEIRIEITCVVYYLQWSNKNVAFNGFDVCIFVVFVQEKDIINAVWDTLLSLSLFLSYYLQ